MPILYSIALLLLSVNVLLVVPKVMDFISRDLTKSTVLGSNININTEESPRVKLPRSKGLLPPKLSATAVWIEDIDLSIPLYIQDPHKRVPIASTTKIMTALTAVSYFQVDQILTASDFLPDGSTMGLKVGEKISFRNLLYGMLLNSGNDAAFTIAANFPGGVEGFMKEMNNQARGMGLNDTYFDNPAGFDSPNHFSSAKDLSRIAVLAEKNPYLARIFSVKEATIRSADGVNIHYLRNLNKMLDDPQVLGIKTGTTPLAKENLVALIERDNHRIIIVVLGSNDRFKETRELIEWVYQNFIWD